MDVQNVQSKRELVRRRGSSNNKKALKVVYISSPMKVKTCASKFRALVQELTGKDSDTARMMEVNGGEYSPTVSEQSPVDDRGTWSGKEELLPVDSVFGERYEDHNFLVPQMNESFYGMLPSNLFVENSQFDALRCFGGP
ncbi:hypothetical protein HS088_TW16G00084 [Tripterygium wilfordii]|uniref:VQ domain-containing protein n=1 Tax=Tripterygium wilfordii TaxID=458696 RepID=A0A7J7CHW8_TRIWF|nr:sigma factor binding protein 2, chloroplastic-like [Tripterygium wilfordii]KAF5733644.1 hypothetical protein HS088_TW16G00084 [Tripterygium wilfordii]